MKKLLIAFLCCISLSSFASSCHRAEPTDIQQIMKHFLNLACGRAQPTDTPQFCASFKAAATCYCTEMGLPQKMCSNMRVLYDRMLVIYRTVDKACEAQHHTTKQDCMDNWRCYLSGGIDSTGKYCSGTQQPCE